MLDCRTLRTKAELVKRLHRAVTTLRMDVDALPEKQLVKVGRITNTLTTPIMQAVQRLISAHDKIEQKNFERGERLAGELLREYSEETFQRNEKMNANMNTKTTEIPSTMREDRDGNWVHKNKICKIDLDRDKLVN